MSQSTDHDANPQSQLADYYQWIEPDRGIRIYINFETADRLQVQVLGVFDSDGGMEVGGILLGRTALEEGRITAIIEDFAAVPCAYSRGPLYSVTGADAVNFEAALERFKADTSSGLSIVGYYRSHRRADLYLSPDDLILIQSAFPAIDNVFLLIKPLAIRACTAGFFFWEDGNIQSEFTLEVPFAPVRPPSPKPSEADSIDDVLLPVRLDLSANLTTFPLGQLPGPALPYRKCWYGRARDLAAVTLSIALSLGIFGYWQVRRSKMSRIAPVSHEVPGGVQPALSAALPPAVKVERAPVTSPARGTAVATQTGTLRKEGFRQRPSQPVFIENPPVSGIAHDSEPAQATAGVSDPPPNKLEQPPSLPNEIKISELAVPPTAVKPLLALQNATPLEIPPPRAQTINPIPPSAATSSPEPGLPPQLLKTSFVGPQIIYRIDPAVPLDVRTLIVGETKIDVGVIIDVKGTVTDAQVTSTRGVGARLLAAEAIKAARLFRFQPARENDLPVQSRMVLTFRFRRTGE